MKLVKAINAERKEHALTDTQLSKAFSKWWPEFETPFADILANYEPQKQVPKRPLEEMIEEILELCRSIQRSLQPLPAWATAALPKSLLEEGTQRCTADELLRLAGLKEQGPELPRKITKLYPKKREQEDKISEPET